MNCYLKTLGKGNQLEALLIIRKCSLYWAWDTLLLNKHKNSFSTQLTSRHCGYQQRCSHHKKCQTRKCSPSLQVLTFPFPPNRDKIKLGAGAQSIMTSKVTSTRETLFFSARRHSLRDTGAACGRSQLQGTPHQKMTLIQKKISLFPSYWEATTITVQPGKNVLFPKEERYFPTSTSTILWKLIKQHQ